MDNILDQFFGVILDDIFGVLAVLVGGAVCAIIIWLLIMSTKAQMEEDRLKWEEQMSPKVRFEKFMQKHPKLKDKTTIRRIKTFIAQQYAYHRMVKELYRLYLLDCDATGKTPLSYRKWKFAYGL